MKIGFDAKRIFHNTTGLGNYGRDLVRILSSFYPKNDYVLYNPKPKIINRLEIEKNISEVLPNSRFWRILSSIWRQSTIINQLKEDNIEVFHGLSGEIPKGIEKTSIRTVVTIHDLIFVRFPQLYSFFDRKIHFKKVKFSAEKTNRIIAISEQTKRDIIHFLKIDEAKIDVVYQGCHATFKEEKTDNFKNYVKEKFNLPNEFILNVGAINKRKNILSLIKSIEKINTVLIVVGAKTSYFKIVKNYVNEHQLNDKVRFLSDVTMKELSAIYQLATVFVYPSIFEGFGIPIIEALYSKVPVITSLGGCFLEAGGPNSYYINPQNIQEMKDSIEFLLNNSSERNRISQEGISFVQKFNDREIAKKIHAVYQKLN